MTSSECDTSATGATECAAYPSIGAGFAASGSSWASPGTDGLDTNPRYTTSLRQNDAANAGAARDDTRGSCTP